MFVAHDHYSERPRLLIIHDDPEIVRSMLAAVSRACCGPTCIGGPDGADAPWHVTCSCAERGAEHPCFVVLSTLRELHGFDLSTCDVVICASSLDDGSGLDALAYLRGIRPDVPVIIAGDDSESPFAVEAIRAGAADFLITSSGELHMLPLAIEKCLAHQHIRQENEQLQDDLRQSLSETAMKNRQLQSLIHQLETMARTDDLTGLYNRRWLNLMLERTWSDAVRHGLPLAFIMIDLDGFKPINDALGHLKGDELLQMTARVLDTNCRQVDFPARYGGDEFCILMPNTLPNEAALVALRVQRAFISAQHARITGEMELGMSIGLSHVMLSKPANTDQLITHADEALYAAKNAGTNLLMVRERDKPVLLEQSRAIIDAPHAPMPRGDQRRESRHEPVDEQAINMPRRAG